MARALRFRAYGLDHAAGDLSLFAWPDMDIRARESLGASLGGGLRGMLK